MEDMRPALIPSPLQRLRGQRRGHLGDALASHLSIHLALVQAFDPLLSVLNLAVQHSPNMQLLPEELRIPLEAVGGKVRTKIDSQRLRNCPCPPNTKMIPIPPLYLIMSPLFVNSVRQADGEALQLRTSSSSLMEMLKWRQS